MSKKTNMPKAEVFPVALIQSCGSFDDVLGDIRRLYDEQRVVFMSSDANDDDLPKKAAAWAKVSRELIRTAGADFCRYPADMKRQENALHIIEMCKTDSFLRERNLMLHYDLAREAGLDDQKLDKKRDAVLESIDFCARAVNTQASWVRKYLNGESYEPLETRMYREAGKKVHDMAKIIPEGHDFYPARVFPPYRVPAGERVPYSPPAFRAFKNLPAEDFIYDAEHDEFVLPKGYLSPDGRIDDQSVVFNWEDRTVACKFHGEEEPIIWPFWKPRTTFDLPEEGSWCEEYMKRVRRQLVQDMTPPGVVT